MNHLYKPWSFEAALKFVRHLEAHTSQVGFHVALMGSVLHKGQSQHDLDVIVFPHNTNKFDMEPLDLMFGKAGLTIVASRARVAKVWELSGSTDTKHVEVWAYRGKRVDLFFLR